jgi:hypothetical protein
MESFLKNPFQNPFGGAMNPSGGGGGVLEQIQEQVNTNGETLQSLQGGIGGLPNTPFRNPGDLLDLSTFKPPIAPVQDELRLPTGFEPLPTPSIAGAATDIDAQLRAEYDELVASAQKRRAEGFLGRMVLPGENLSFEEFKKMQAKTRLPFNMLGGPMQSDIFNIAQPVQNPGIGLIQDPGISYITGDLFGDINTGLNDEDRIAAKGTPLQAFQKQDHEAQLRENVGNRGYTGGGAPPVFIDGVNVNQNPTPSMDQLFGRAFAGKPI